MAQEVLGHYPGLQPSVCDFELHIPGRATSTTTEEANPNITDGEFVARETGNDALNSLTHQTESSYITKSIGIKVLHPTVPDKLHFIEELHDEVNFLNVFLQIAYCVLLYLCSSLYKFSDLTSRI